MDFASLEHTLLDTPQGPFGTVGENLTADDQLDWPRFEIINEHGDAVEIVLLKAALR